jgi:flagellar protein FliS
MNAMELAYRKTAAQGASGLGLLIALYDTLAGDLRRAAEAERANNIQKRCEAANHALLVVSHLEDRIIRGNGGELAESLTAFYRTLRRKLIEAQAKRSPEILEEQIALVLDIRRTWQELDSRVPPQPEARQWVPTSEFPGSSSSLFERRAFNWSA